MGCAKDAHMVQFPLLTAKPVFRLMLRTKTQEMNNFVDHTNGETPMDSATPARMEQLLLKTEQLACGPTELANSSTFTD